MAGVTLNDRKLAAEVRTLTLREIKFYLESDGSDKETEAYKKQLVLKLAPTVLPRINEHSGEDGSPINISLVKYGDTIASQIPTEALPDTAPEGA